MYIIIAEFIIFVIWDAILFNTKNFFFYYKILSLIQYTRATLTHKLEKLLFSITFWANKRPYLLYKNKPSYSLIKDFDRAVSWKEKSIIIIEFIFRIISSLLELRPGYFFMGITYIGLKFKYEIINFLNTLYLYIINIDWLAKIQTCYKYCYDNGNAILIIIIVCLMLYICKIKNKEDKYKFEKIWADEVNSKTPEVARLQKEIEKELSQLLNPLSSNILVCESYIRIIDWNIDTDLEPKLKNILSLEDYSNIISQIKKYIEQIEKLNAISLYKKHNQKIWFQFQFFELTNSNNNFYYTNDISDCDKSIIENYLKETDQKIVRKSLLNSWRMGIAIENGIFRILNHSYRRKHEYDKLMERNNKIASLYQNLMEIK